jgi:hypothetical protein
LRGFLLPDNAPWTAFTHTAGQCLNENTSLYSFDCASNGRTRTSSFGVTNSYKTPGVFAIWTSPHPSPPAFTPSTYPPITIPGSVWRTWFTELPSSSGFCLLTLFRIPNISTRWYSLLHLSPATSHFTRLGKIQIYSAAKMQSAER